MKRLLGVVLCVVFLVFLNTSAFGFCTGTPLANPGIQLNVGADLHYLTIMTDGHGCVHPDEALFVATPGNDELSECDPPGQTRIYSLDPYSDSISFWNVPQAVDYQVGDHQHFFSVMKPQVMGSPYKQVWFATDSNKPHIYYNKQDSYGNWQYGSSQKVIDMGSTGTLAVMDVLYDSSAIFRNPHNGSYYRYCMYLVNQSGCWMTMGGTAGVLAVAYSNDGISWVGPYDVGNPNCNFNQATHVEMGGALLYGSTIYIMVLEGDLSILASQVLSGSTLSYMYSAPVSNPESISILGGGSPITASGLYSPNAGGYAQTDCLMNVSMSFDPASGVLYMARAYAYPVNYQGSNVPCLPGSVCKTGLTTNGIRTQLYSMSLGVPPNLNNLWSSSWSLVDDWGAEDGYQMDQ
ncbi:MAG: hypothetical protein ACLFUL_06335 [Desulfobacteraceae bacterium]